MRRPLPDVGFLLAVPLAIMVGGAADLVAFGAGYMGVWLLVGLVPLLAFLMFRNLTMQAQTSAWLQAPPTGMRASRCPWNGWGEAL